MLFEQCDMIMILLNLAYIPDEVVKKIKFENAGWSYEMKIEMDNYKKQFNQRPECGKDKEGKCKKCEWDW